MLYVSNTALIPITILTINTIISAIVEKANDFKVPYKIVDRRPGDIATCYAEATKAKNELGWVAKREIEQMCKDSWHFERKQLTETV